MHIIRHGQRVEVDDNYVLRSGEALALPLSLMDSDTRRERAEVGLSDADVFARDAYGVPSGHTRGYVFTVDTAIRQRAADAYEERSAWLRDAWRHRADEQQHDDQDHGRGDQKPAPRSLADAQAAAERAYLDKVERLKNAWKNRDAA